MCLTIIVIALVSSQVTQQSSSSDDDQHMFISSVSAAAMIMINSGNKEQIIEWKHYLHEHYGIQLILLPLTTSEQSETDEEFSPIINKIQQNNFSNNDVISRPFVISQPLTTNNGLRYRLIAKLPEDVFEHYTFNRGNIIFRFAAAILIGGFICYLLSLYLLRPIRVLQRAARKLGQGEFQTRVRSILGNRNDEIGELAHDFDEMAARLESLIHSKQQLLQDISHELRSPLARLSVALEIARDKSPYVEKELTRIAYETDKLNELIRQILSLASLDASQNKMQFENIDLVEMLQSIVSDANYEVQNRTTPILLKTPNSCHTQVSYSLLRSALENIIRNALRYSPDDKPISITLLQKESDIQITIEDSGPGIPEDKLAHIFDPFFRVDDSRTQRTGGFGLGLAIAKRAIFLHKGHIVASNLPHGGLKVVVVIPERQAYGAFL
jgi:two-component system sensor histidine kinase CpxA